MHPTLHIAIHAARAAADILLKASSRPDRIRVLQDSPEAFVTSVHQEAEAALLAHLHKMHPKARITSALSGEVGAGNTGNGGDEAGKHKVSKAAKDGKAQGGGDIGEGRGVGGGGERRADIHWLIDPLFGGRNYLAGLPEYGVSLLCREQGRNAHALVLLPQNDEEFLASRGGGARHNHRRLRAQNRGDLAGALIGLDLNTAGINLPPHLLQDLATAGAHCRSSACPPLDLLATAANRLQGGFCRAPTGSSITSFAQDPAFAAARFILQESGGLIADERGNPDLSNAPFAFYGNPATLKQLLRLAATAPQRRESTGSPPLMDALETLHSRVSFPKLQEPAPSAQQMQNLYRAALRAADHGVLRPWRFLTIQDKSRDRLGELMVDAARKENPALTDEEAARLRQKPLRAPLIVVVVASPKEHPKVPEWEQELSAAAAAQNILLAAHAQGLGAMWRTGPAAYSRPLMQALGLTKHEKIIGFLYLGTPATSPKQITEASPHNFTQDW